MPQRARCPAILRIAAIAQVGVAAVAAGAPLLADHFLIAPSLQDARSDGALVSFETAAPIAAEVIVDVPGGARRFPSPVATGAGASGGLRHEVRVAGLPPGRYPYRVVAGAATESGTLATAATGDAFTFLVYGDNRDRDADHARVIAAMVTEPADLVIHTGDMTGDAGDTALWQRFFAIEAPLLRSTPMYPTLGNHEYIHDPLASHYHRYFAPPVDPAGVTPPRQTPYYAFRYANALFIALDGTRSRDRAQAAWLHRTLAHAAGDKSVHHVFVFQHQPPFSVTDFCGSAAEQGLWVPEFRRYGVRAVFAGHAHAYEHMERNGVRYFVTGGGGAPLVARTNDCPAYDERALRTFRSVHHFLRVRIRGDEAVLDALGVDGEVIETVRLNEPAPVEATPPPPIPYVDPRPPGDAPAVLTPWRRIAAFAGVMAFLALLLFGWRRRRA